MVITSGYLLSVGLVLLTTGVAILLIGAKLVRYDREILARMITRLGVVEDAVIEFRKQRVGELVALLAELNHRHIEQTEYLHNRVHDIRGDMQTIAMSVGLTSKKLDILHDLVHETQPKTNDERN